MAGSFTLLFTDDSDKMLMLSKRRNRTRVRRDSLHAVYDIHYSILIHTVKGVELNQREGEKGNSFYKATSKIQTWLNVSPVHIFI
jgi:hypothetical protein